MSQRRRAPEGQAHRIQAANQARGERAKRHLERARQRHRHAIKKESRSRRQSTVDPGPWRRVLATTCFTLSLAVGAAWAWPALDVASDLGGGSAHRIERMAIQGLRRLSTAEVAAATQVRPGEESRDIDPLEVEARLRTHPWIRDAQVMRLPGGKLLVQIEERVPVALLAPRGESKVAAWRLVDVTGTPFANLGEARPADLGDWPVFRGGEARPADLGDWPVFRGGEALIDGLEHPELAAALALDKHLRSRGLATLLADGASVELRLPRAGDSQGWTLFTPRGGPLVVLGREHLVQRLARLETLLRAGIDSLDAATTIDLRFADRAILRSSSASG